MSFFKSSASSSPAPVASQKLEEIKAQVKSQMALEQAQELTQKLSDKCYQMCVTSPSDKLQSREEGCLETCVQRYLETFNIVSRTYYARVHRERDAQVLNAPSS